MIGFLTDWTAGTVVETARDVVGGATVVVVVVVEVEVVLVGTVVVGLVDVEVAPTVVLVGTVLVVDVVAGSPHFGGRTAVPLFITDFTAFTEPNF